MTELLKEYWLFYLLTFVAEVIGTLSGFGSSIIFVPVASLFFEFDIVLGITAIFHVFSNLSKISLFNKGIDKNIAIKLGIPAVIFVILGAYFTNFFQMEGLELGMNFTLLALAVVLIYNHDKKLNQSNQNLIGGGVVSGFLAGLFGSGGSVRGLTMSSFDLNKETFIATSALIDLGVDLSRSVVYSFNGYVKEEYLIVILPLIGISFIGSYIGKLIVDKISHRSFKFIALGVITTASVVQIILHFSTV
ncbi:MAG: sulfite exporter TauE/SafE family protein [Flavobacteriales bacterium]|nr:sulfite exporter TauE/SafE family protein [Flavobacteriales bacterium]